MYDFFYKNKSDTQLYWTLILISEARSLHVQTYSCKIPGNSCGGDLIYKVSPYFCFVCEKTSVDCFSSVKPSLSAITTFKLF